MNIILVWIQWSGKWTQARKIVEKYWYSFFEMWQKLRNFSELDLPESTDVKNYLSDWKLVPIELIWKILIHYLNIHKDVSVLFDWIPRTPDQKDMFDLIVKDYIIIFLDLNKLDAIERLSWRRIDPVTWESFWPEFIQDINPKTGNQLIIRDDDKPEAVSKRVDTFYQNTLPLLALWAAEWKKVYKIDASKTVEEVFSQIENIIESK